VPRRALYLALVPFSALVLVLPRTAHAFENQWHLGAGLGVATLSGSEYKTGPAAGLHGAYGLSDTFDLRIELLASHHTLDVGDETREAPTAQLLSAAAGVAYKVDVLEWIPYAGLLGGYAAFLGDSPSDLGLSAPGDQELTVSVVLGIDYAHSRSFGLGAQLRYTGFLSDLPDSLADAQYFALLLRAEYRWGW
jgi:hypothetical protein